MKATRRIAIYARRSQEHGSKDKSIAEQIAACRAWALSLGYVVVVVYEERHSGASGDDRPEFLRALADAKLGRYEILVTWNLSRFGRTDNDEAGYWRHLFRQAGVEIAHVMEGDRYSGEGGEIVRTVDQHAARKHLIDTASATARGQGDAVRLRRAWPNGSAPYGYRLVRRTSETGRPYTTLEPIEAEARVVSRIYELRLTGLGYLAIARILNGDELPSPAGGVWVRSSISLILANPAYVGDIARGQGRRGKKRRHRAEFYSCSPDGPVAAADAEKGKGVVASDAHPAIVPRDLWEQAQRVNLPETPHKPPTGGGPRLFTGLAVCGECGGTISVDSGGRNRRIYYFCVNARQGKTNCKGVSHRLDLLEPVVLDAIRTNVVKLDPERLAAKVRELVPRVAAEDVGGLEVELRKIDQRVSLVVSDLNASDEMTSKALAGLREKRQAASARLDRARVQREQAPDVDAMIAQAVQERERLDLTPDTTEGKAKVRKAVRAFVARLALHGGERGKPKAVSLDVYEPHAVAVTSSAHGFDEQVLTTARYTLARPYGQHGSRL